MSGAPTNLALRMISLSDLVTDRCKLTKWMNWRARRNHIATKLALPDWVRNSSHFAWLHLVGLVP
jgi:hypothetical protein